MLLFSVSCRVLSQTVRGKVTDEDGIELPAVTVINIASDKKTYTDADGTFSVDASAKDEIRFIRPGFERASVRAGENLNGELNIKLMRTAREIEEVRFPISPEILQKMPDPQQGRIKAEPFRMPWGFRSPEEKCGNSLPK